MLQPSISRLGVLLIALVFLFASHDSNAVEQKDFYQLVGFAVLSKNGDICMTVGGSAYKKGDRVILADPTGSTAVAYAEIVEKRPEGCAWEAGDYGDTSYRLRITKGSIKPATSYVAVVDSKLRLQLKKGILSGRLSTGERIALHACNGGDGPFYSLWRGQLFGDLCWYMLPPIAPRATLPPCIDRESAHYGE